MQRKSISGDRAGERPIAAGAGSLGRSNTKGSASFQFAAASKKLTLSNFGISGALADPTLELKNASGVTVVGNDDWQQGQPAEIQQAGLAPSDTRESAVITVLPPGQYTAIVVGKGGTTGVAVVEGYAVE